MKQAATELDRSYDTDKASERGATAVEYALIVAAIAIAIVLAVTGLGNNVGASMNKSSGSMAGGEVVAAAAPTETTVAPTTTVGASSTCVLWSNVWGGSPIQYQTTPVGRYVNGWMGAGYYVYRPANATWYAC